MNLLFSRLFLSESSVKWQNFSAAVIPEPSPFSLLLVKQVQRLLKEPVIGRNAVIIFR